MWKSRIGRQIQGLSLSQLQHELFILSNCLETKWHVFVLDLEAGLQDVTNQVEAMYNQDSLKTVSQSL